jgi:3,4-dihydroxy-2-butanone 4-phosphate synthase
MSDEPEPRKLSKVEMAAADAATSMLASPGASKSVKQINDSTLDRSGHNESVKKLKEAFQIAQPSVLKAFTEERVKASRLLTDQVTKAARDTLATASRLDRLLITPSSEVVAIELLREATQKQATTTSQLVDLARSQQSTMEEIADILKTETARQAKWWRDPRFIVGSVVGVVSAVVAGLILLAVGG